MRTKKDIRYSNISKLDELDIYYAENEKGTIIYFHGGGFTEGSKYDPHMVQVAESFANQGYTFISVNYSLYPDTKFPSYLIEAAKAVGYVCNILNIKHPYISGTSAGAYITMMLCFNKELLLNEGVDPLDIKGWIFESGQPTSHFNIMAIEKGLDPELQRIDELAPLYYVDKNTRLSPSLFILYTNDIVNRYEQNKLLISVLRHYDKECDITELLLNGYHCEGSSHADETGDFPFVYQTIKWIEK
ncbi:MAG: alpha/beta hydrolase [Bacilli bacterium]|nr:alpha/beta hydrolase [Bacilli bacterium]